MSRFLDPDMPGLDDIGLDEIQALSRLYIICLVYVSRLKAASTIPRNVAASTRLHADRIYSYFSITDCRAIPDIRYKDQRFLLGQLNVTVSFLPGAMYDYGLPNMGCRSSLGRLPF
jgi:hypothetical protein